MVRTQRERREHTERRLLEAAARLIAERGPRAATLAAVGEAAGYSRGIVTHHFGSREALLTALLTHVQRDFVPTVDDLAPGLDRLLTLVDGYLAALDAGGARGRAFLLLWADSIAAAPELRPIFEERDQYLRALLTDDLRAGAAAGRVRPGIDLEATSLALLGQLRGLGLHLVNADAADGKRLRTAVVDLWRNSLAA
ncbi:TetR/AcrR family transcriptional regulator [Streptomyces sp. NBC_00996]|uniref:TetR/AcrR family transcriptional regulator n=1 Tax=Streptomyces sp. NBC_00996 TaxID=2903710 RepID=UPI00386A35A2|nr:TetR/AcrR family transcriptional regulator [Streptomyces sp. NBC_00996]